MTTHNVTNLEYLPNIKEGQLQAINPHDYASSDDDGHAPRFLLLYGSLRKRSFSRLVAEESARLLHRLGAETRLFNPSGLPFPDDADAEHPKVKELRDLAMWSEGMVWISPERHAR